MNSSRSTVSSAPRPAASSLTRACSRVLGFTLFACSALAQANYQAPYAITTLAGNLSPDDVGLEARFSVPAGMALDAEGTLFIADSGFSSIRKVAGDMTVSTLAGGSASGWADGDVTTARFSVPRGVALDAAGNLYVADTNNHVIRKITRAGVVSTIAGFPGAPGSVDGTKHAARFSSPWAVAVDASGNVWVADSENHTIRKIDTIGNVTTPAGLAGTSGMINGSGSLARFNYPTGLAFDAAGVLHVADLNNGAIRKISAGTVSTLAMGLSAPHQLTFDAGGVCLFTEASGQRVKKVTPNGVVSLLAGSGQVGTTDGSATTARFTTPMGIAVNPNGTVIVSDLGSALLRQVSATGVVTTVAGSAGTSFNARPGAVDATGAAARFNLPGGIVIEPAGNAYVADTLNSAIRKITPASVVTVFAGTMGAAGTANGTGSAARFSSPQAVARDASGNFYVSDCANHTIRKITPAGVVTTLAGSPGVSGYANGLAALFRFPWGIAVDGAGNVFVGDSENFRIRKINPAGVVTTFAGSGTAGITDGTGTAAAFRAMHGLAFDAAGNLLVADATAVRKITPAGVVTTVAGSATATGTTDGTGPAARFISAEALAVRADGYIAIADRANTIRLLSPAGVVTTLAGVPAVGVADGTGSLARFNQPQGLAFDATGRLLISDSSNHAIRGGVPAVPVYTSPTTRALALGAAPNLVTSWLAQPTSFAATGLPPGITLNPTTGALAGTATQAGEFETTLTATNSIGSGAANLFLIVTNAPPVAVINTFTSPPVVDVPFAFSASASTAPETSDAIVSYLWNFGDGSPPETGMTPSHVFPSPGTRTITLTVTDSYGATGTTSVSTFVVKLNQTISFATIPNHGFGDAPFALEATASSGLPITFSIVSGPATISGNTLTLTGAGTVTVRAAQAGNATYNSAPSVQRSFSVAKGAATVAFNSLTATYTGTPLAVATTTTPSGLAVTKTYNGSASAPTNAGSYAVIATINDANYAGSTSGTFTIAPATQTIAFGALAAKTFGDAPFAPTATASSGLPVTLSILSGPATLNAGTITLTGAGAVTVRASQVGNANYAAAPDVDQTFTVAKTAATIALGNLSATYDGEPHAASATTTPEGLNVALTYEGGPSAPTNAGNYAVIATVNDTNYAGSTRATLVIERAPQEIIFGKPGQYRYGDAPFLLDVHATSSLPVALAIVSGPATLSGNVVTLTGAGEVTIRATQGGDNNFAPAEPTELVLGIARGQATIELGQLVVNYDGNPHAPSVGTSPAGLPVAFIFSNRSTTPPTEAGSYAVAASIADPNYTGSASATFTIARAPQTIAFNPVPGMTYGARPFTVAAVASSGLPVNFSIVSGPATLEGNSVTIIGAGEVVVRAAQGGDTNYAAAAPVDQSFTVGKANQAIAFSPVEGITFGDAPFVVSATANSALGVSFNLVSGPATLARNLVTITGAGPVTVRASQAGDANHNPAPDVDQTFTVGKANQAIAFVPVADASYGAAPFALSATSSAGVPVTFSVANGPATIAGTMVTLSGAGPVILRASAAGNDNYNAAPNVDRTITVARAPLTVTAANTTRVFGEANPVLAVTYSGFVNGDTAVVLDTAPTATTPATTASQVGSYPITVSGGADDNYSFTYIAGSLTVAPAEQVITFGPLANRTFGDPAFTVGASSSFGLPVSVTVASGPSTISGDTVTLTGAGIVTLRATQAGNGNVLAATPIEQSFTVAPRTATIALGVLDQIYTGTPRVVIAGTSPAGLPVELRYNGSLTPPIAVGSYVVTATIADPNYSGSASGTLVVSAANPNVAIAIADLVHAYDGQPKSVTITTTPANALTQVTYNGSTTPPTLPGSYAVVATATSGQGSASGTLVITVTALVRHAPTLNGDIEGSVQVLLPESTTLNGGAMISGDLLVPGTPTLRRNGNPTFAGMIDSAGASTPSNYEITLNGGSVLRRLVRRVDALTMPSVSAPTAPTGTRSVAVNSANNASATIGSFSTLRNLTLNGNGGAITVPAGAYGSFTANGNSGFVLGVAGATTPAVYHFQSLTLNGNTELKVVGPVVITLATSLTANGTIGSAAHPEWLTLRVASGGVTLNGNVTLAGEIVAPSGTVTVNGNSQLIGRVTSDRLTLNGNALLRDPALE